MGGKLTYLWNRFLAFGERRYIEIFGDVPAIPAEMRRSAKASLRNQITNEGE